MSLTKTSSSTYKYTTSGLSFFFFSSRRRHTRLTCDWSSDVCSSDLSPRPSSRRRSFSAPRCIDFPGFVCYTSEVWSTARSEERRVGKECRSRWSPDHEKKKKSDQPRRDDYVRV